MSGGRGVVPAQRKRLTSPLLPHVPDSTQATRPTLEFFATLVMIRSEFAFNVTLLGIFTSLRATHFPTPYRSIMVYTLLSGDPGENGQLRLRCVSELTGEVSADESMRVQVGDQGMRQVRFWLDAVRFPESGPYRFTVTFEADVIAELTIHVQEA